MEIADVRTKAHIQQIEVTEVINNFNRELQKWGNQTAFEVKDEKYKSSFMSYLKGGARDNNLLAKNAMRTDSSNDGGYLVPVELSTEIEKRALAAVALRRLATVVTSKSGEYKKPMSMGGVAGGWVAEREERPTTNNPQIALFSPILAEMYSSPSATNSLIESAAFDIESWLLGEVSDLFNLLEGQAFINGKNPKMPTGILDPDRMVENAGITFGKIGYIKSGHATLLNSTDCLINLQSALHPTYRANSTWLMNDNTLSSLRRLKDGNGSYILQSSLTDSAPDRLLGRPVEIDSNMPDIGAGSYPILFADFKRAYTIVDSIYGVRTLRDPYTIKGVTIYYTTKRVGGGVCCAEAAKALKISE